MLLNGFVWLYRVATSDGGMWEGTALDMRFVAYPLWTAEVVMMVVAALLTARVVRRITEAQLRTVVAGVAR